jgi:hypothetical protein
MDHPRWRISEDNTLGEVCILGDNREIVLLCVCPKLGVRGSWPKLGGVRHGQAGLQRRNSRKVLVEEEPGHSTLWTEYWLPISRAA